MWPKGDILEAIKNYQFVIFDNATKLGKTGRIIYIFLYIHMCNSFKNLSCIIV